MAPNGSLGIPDHATCFQHMVDVNLPLHIRAHSLMVARCAMTLAEDLLSHCPWIDLQLVESGALLHDIAKGICLETGQDHARLGATMVEAWGYYPLSPIVRDHVSLAPEDLKAPLNESLIVNYADKRVCHTRIVSLADRFKDLAKRYATTNEHRLRLKRRMKRYVLLEEEIFSRVNLYGPKDLERHVSQRFGSAGIPLADPVIATHWK